jgi:hypothetical protein
LLAVRAEENAAQQASSAVAASIVAGSESEKTTGRAYSF